MGLTLQKVDLSALGAQAIAQVERARKQAAAQLASVMQQRPKLKLHARLDGPKVAVPISASPTGEGAHPSAIFKALSLLKGRKGLQLDETRLPISGKFIQQVPCHLSRGVQLGRGRSP